jgi:hypothetical protein
MPLYFEATGIIGKENHAALKEAHDQQQSMPQTNRTETSLSD